MEKEKSISPAMTYSDILDTFGLKYHLNGFYLEVGKIRNTQNWLIQLSVIHSQISDLLLLLIPHLMIKGAAFKVVRDENIASHLLEGALGYENLGHIMSIDPGENSNINQFAKEIIALTNEFKGPEIPSARQLGNIVYTRYTSLSIQFFSDETGAIIPYTYDKYGNLVPDRFTIPFSLPKNEPWPFSDITKPEPRNKKLLLKNTYYPLKVLKADAKGYVIRALYLKKGWKPNHCIVKEGRHNMLADEHGRDIASRLKWQYQLYQQLKNTVPIPEIFDYFEDDRSSYLAMQHIESQPVTDFINAVLCNRCWRHISNRGRQVLLEVLIKILEIVTKLHEHGIIHRDITPDNFLINKHFDIYLIDMELAWDSKQQYPNPAFKLGTEGHMSPEQRANHVPNIFDDIYGIGGLMTILFTGVLPVKIINQELPELRESLLFFIGDVTLSNVIAECFHKNPDQRPSIPRLLQIVKKHKDDLLNGLNPSPSYPILDSSEIRNRIQKAILALSKSEFLTSNQLWLSLPKREEQEVGNMQMDITVYEGWHTGISGPLWLISKCKQDKYNITACEETYKNNANWIINLITNTSKLSDSGLFYGTAGIALSIGEGIKENLIKDNDIVRQILLDCFERTAKSCDLSTGVAGQGYALIYLKDLVDYNVYKTKLHEYAEKILTTQEATGVWKNHTNIKDINTGLENGVSGICLFLLKYLEEYENEKVRDSIIKGLSWLNEINPKTKKENFWTTSIESKKNDPYNSLSGLPGIIILFATAFKVLGDPKYKTLSNKILIKIPPNPVITELNAGYGLSGLGLSLIYAYNIYKEEEYKVRADWIAQLLLRCNKNIPPNSVSWQTGFPTTQTVDLSCGTSGVIYFLQQYINTNT
jgi:serine/threonine protein kinase